MSSRLTISDTQATIGEERLTIDNPLPHQQRTPDSAIYACLEDLSDTQAELLRLIASQQRRIEALEARTWWSMLVDQIRAFWRG